MIVQKPWGYEHLIEKNDKYVVKKLFMKAGNRCSLQYHEKKHETFYVLSGSMNFYVGDSPDKLDSFVYSEGCAYVIPPGLIHRMEAITDCMYIECSTPELDDVVRLQDSYGRTP